MSFTADPKNSDQKTCDQCGITIPASSGHICADILHAHGRLAKGLAALAPEPKKDDK